MLQNNLLLALEVDGKMDRKFRLHFFNKSVKKMIMPGGFFIFLLFFLATMVTNPTTTWDRTFFSVLFFGE